MTRETFDPTDPVEAMADRFRREVVELALRAMDDPTFKAMPPEVQAQCFLAGAATGVIGVLFSGIEDSGRDGMMRALEDYLPYARQQAEDIFENQPH